MLRTQMPTKPQTYAMVLPSGRGVGNAAPSEWARAWAHPQSREPTTRRGPGSDPRAARTARSCRQG